MPLEKDERLRRGNHLPGFGLLYGQAKRDQRRSCHQVLPAAAYASHGRHHDLSRPQSHAHREVHALVHFIAVEFGLQVQATLRGTARGGWQVLVRVIGGPGRQQGIAGELDNIAPVGSDGADELSEVFVEQVTQFLRTDRATLTEARCQGSRAGDIGKEDCCRKVFCSGGGDWSRGDRLAAHDQCRHVTGICLKEA